jgi:hypothetical protein
MAATLLSHHFHTTRSTPPPFRLAVFICGAIPGDFSALKSGELRALDPNGKDGGVIAIPTAHVIGQKDPVMHDSEVLRDVCDKGMRRVFESEGGHDIPRAPRETVKEMVGVIRDVVDRATFAQ